MIWRSVKKSFWGKVWKLEILETSDTRKQKTRKVRRLRQVEQRKIKIFWLTALIIKMYLLLVAKLTYLFSLRNNDCNWKKQRKLSLTKNRRLISCCILSLLYRTREFLLMRFTSRMVLKLCPQIALMKWLGSFLIITVDKF